MMNLAIGTAQFGSDYGITNQDGLISYENGKEIINFCYDNGIDTLDTAVLYGNSETNLGNIGVEKFKVITKIPSIPDNFSDVSNSIKKIVESSKEKLKLNLDCTEDQTAEKLKHFTACLKIDNKNVYEKKCESNESVANNELVKLGPKEFKLLQLLAERPGHIFSREKLLDSVWGHGVFIEDRTVDVHMSRLRKALRINETDTDLIRTVRDGGYGLLKS